MLCCAITETHLALGLPSGALHVYGIGGILDIMASLQARAVHTLTKTWRTPSSELLVEASDSLGSDGAPHSHCRRFRRLLACLIALKLHGRGRPRHRSLNWPCPVNQDTRLSQVPSHEN